jgi:signal transduction histidine kinase
VWRNWFSGSDPRGAARGARVAILLLGGYLLLLNLAGLWISRNSLRAQDISAGEYLEQIGRRMIDPPRDYFWVLEYTWNPTTGLVDEDGLATYSQLGEWRTLTESLASAENEERIRRVDLLTPAGQILLSTDRASAEDRSFFLEREADAIKRAAGGEVVLSQITPQSIQKCIHLPVRTKARDVVAILRMEGDNFERLVTLRSRLFFGLLLSMGVLLFLWFWTLKMVKRTIEAERSAAQSDRLRALGTMTAGIAHEIRNPLGIISLQAEELKALSAEVADPTLREALQATTADLQKEARRLKDLTHSFLAFSKASSATNKEAPRVDVNGCVEGTVRLWQKGLRPELRTVRFEPAARTVSAIMQEDRLKQILLNLLRNADEALGSQVGEITVAVEPSGNHVRISIRDNGPGISREAQAQIFDPFFTTRAEGTGLGLSLSRALAEAAKGNLEVNSELGAGATFTLTLRLAPDA